MLKLELTIVQGVVRRVGEAIIRIGGKHYAEALREPDWSIVTKADLEADRLPRETPLQEFSEYGWLSSWQRQVELSPICLKRLISSITPILG